MNIDYNNEWVLEDDTDQGSMGWVDAATKLYVDFSLASRFASQVEAQKAHDDCKMHFSIKPALRPAGDWVLESSTWSSPGHAGGKTTWLGLPSKQVHPPVFDIKEARRFRTEHEAISFRISCINSSFSPAFRPIKPIQKEDMLGFPAIAKSSFGWENKGSDWILCNKPDDSLSARVILTTRFDFQARVWVDGKEAFNNRGFITKAEATREAEVFMKKVIAGGNEKATDEMDEWRNKLNAIRETK